MAHIGSCWAQPSWLDDVWGLGTWANGVTFVVQPPIPHRLSSSLGTTQLDTHLDPTQLSFSPVLTALAFLGDDGFDMSTPLIFTQNETGPITLSFTGADGSAEDLSTAQSVTFTMQNVATNAVPANAVSLTSPSSSGTAVWTRLLAQVATAGDYLGQGKVVRSDGTVGYYPDGQRGMAITILKAVG